MDKLKVGDRVRIGRWQTVWLVKELEPKGVGAPAPPSTYLVTIAPAGGGGDQVYGNAGLTKVED